MLSFLNWVYAASPKLSLGAATKFGLELSMSPSLLTGRDRNAFAAVPSFAWLPRRYWSRASPRRSTAEVGAVLRALTRPGLMVVVLVGGVGLPGTGQRKATPSRTPGDSL